MTTMIGHRVGCEFHPDTFTDAEMAQIRTDIKTAEQNGYCAICGGVQECAKGCVMRADTFTPEEHAEIKAQIQRAENEGKCAICGGLLKE